jgi:ankyrin repeat protein
MAALNLTQYIYTGRITFSNAASRKEMDIVRLLQAHVNPEDDDIWTTQYFATRCHKSVLKQLLDHSGADTDARDENNRTPLSRAAFGDYQSILDLLFARNDMDSDLRYDKDQATPKGRWKIERCGQRANRRNQRSSSKATSLLLTRSDFYVDFKIGNSRIPLSLSHGLDHNEVTE